MFLLNGVRLPNIRIRTLYKSSNKKRNSFNIFYFFDILQILLMCSKTIKLNNEKCIFN